MFDSTEACFVIRSFGVRGFDGFGVRVKGFGHFLLEFGPAHHVFAMGDLPVGGSPGAHGAFGAAGEEQNSYDQEAWQKGAEWLLPRHCCPHNSKDALPLNAGP